MNNLLIFFAIPFAVIIFSIALQKILRCPFLVAGIILAVLLVITFAVGGDTTLLVLSIVYTILSFLVAFLTMMVSRILNNNSNSNGGNILNNNSNNTELLTINTNNLNNSDTRIGNGCCRRR